MISCSTSLKIPCSSSSHLIKLGLVSGFFKRSSRNSQTFFPLSLRLPPAADREDDEEEEDLGFEEDFLLHGEEDRGLIPLDDEAVRRLRSEKQYK